MKKLAIICLLVVVPSFGYQKKGNVYEGYGDIADRCKDLQCVQYNLDMIDGQIASLIAKRNAFVKRSAEIKKHNVLAPKGVQDPEVAAGRAAKTSKAIGAPAGSDAVFRAIIKQSNEYEQQLLKDKAKK